MDRAGIVARINHGLGIAAGILGEVWSVYRPSDAMTPMATLAMTIGAAVGSDAALKFEKPAQYGDALRYLVGDATSLQVGDLLVANGRTLFVASVGSLARVLLVECNAVVQISQWVLTSGYDGSAEQIVAQGWPVSIVLSGHTIVSPAGLPGDARESAWRILLPALPGVAVTAGSTIVDTGGRRFLIAGVETSAMGLRIDATSSGS